MSAAWEGTLFPEEVLEVLVCRNRGPTLPIFSVGGVEDVTAWVLVFLERHCWGAVDGSLVYLEGSVEDASARV